MSRGGFGWHRADIHGRGTHTMIELQRLSRRAAGLLVVGPLLLAGAAELSPSSALASRRAEALGSKSPTQVIAAAQSALRSSQGYVMAGEMSQGTQKLKLQLTYAGSSKLEMNVTQGSGTAAIIALPTGLYVKANRSYWRSHGGGSIIRYANRWIELPASFSTKFTAQLGQFNPRTLARCLGENHGTLSRDGTTSVNGKRAVVIRDAGGVPGGNPGRLDIASTGPAYPLRVISTGPTLKGGRVDACNDGKGSNVTGSLTLSRFNDPPAVTTPAHPVKVNSTT